MFPAVIALVLVAVLAACGIVDPAEEKCAPIAKPAISVEVRDSATNAPAATGATGIIVDGDFREDLVPTADDLVLVGALDRAGNYEVTIQKEGYASWRVTNVRVERGRCGVVSERLIARLRPST